MTGLAVALLGGLLFAEPSASPVSHADPTRDEEQVERAIADLHRRAANARPGSAQAREIAAALGEIGRGYLERKETGRAIELLSEAYALDPADGLVLAELTLAYVLSEDFAAARFYLRLAEDRMARAPPEIYGVLGDIYYGLNRLDDAVVAWEQFQRLGGQDPAMLRRLARARDEIAVSQGQRSLLLDDFTIYADVALPDDGVRRVGEDLEKEYAEQSRFFGGARLPTAQVVILYAGRAYFSLVSVPDWVSGVYDGKIRVSIEPDAGVSTLTAGVVAHELAHALIRLRSADRAPAWLHEGLAQWLEGRRTSFGDLRETFASRPPVSLPELDRSFSRRLDRLGVAARYAQARGLIEFVVHERGEGAVACLVASLGEGRSMADALQRETGFTDESLVAGWKKWALR